MEEASLSEKAEALRSLAAGPLSSAIAKLSTSSRPLPSGKDFHFLYNFDDLRIPADLISDRSYSLLGSLGSSSARLLSRRSPLDFPASGDLDDAYDSLVDLNDEFYERVDASMDEFHRSRRGDEGSAAAEAFQVVYGKKKKGAAEGRDPSQVKMASTDQKKTGDRWRVPFHIPTIPRPQKEFNILVSNSNEPFRHVWLQKSEDGGRFIHPLEKFSGLDFIDRSIGGTEATKPLPLEDTPFHLVEGVQELKALAAKLWDVNEFAVDLEHNQYRSFQGLTCLMQISTRTDDFVVDSLKLRVHVGRYLREVFKDPSKRKVMHGADRDILWLQRDFGIYVCNLFDTGQASRVLEMERNSLEFLLHHFCGVAANKEYQNADWRLRPLPDEMIKYAREDTHYLLHIYDLMRARLLSCSAESGNGVDLLLEVYKRSSEICLQLYEKELLTDTSYLHIYGLQNAEFSPEQLAVVSGLFEWRDTVAREEDESTGYILPNKTLLEIARQMPLTSGKLRRLLKSKHPFVERNISSVLDVIRSSVGNAAAFESASELLKKVREKECEENIQAVPDDTEILLAFEDPIKVVDPHVDNACDPDIVINDQRAEYRTVSTTAMKEHMGKTSGIVERISDVPSVSSSGEAMIVTGAINSIKPASIASVQVLKKPTHAFGALLGNPASKRKPRFDTKTTTSEREKVEMKVEQIKSSVTLPFYSFSDSDKQTEMASDVGFKLAKLPHSGIPGTVTDSAEAAKVEAIIPLEMDLKDQELNEEFPNAIDDLKQQDCSQHIGSDNPRSPPLDSDSTDQPVSVADLSSSFQECLQSINERRNLKQMERKARQFESHPKFKPFDYAAARDEVKFGRFSDHQEATSGEDPSRVPFSTEVGKGSVSSGSNREERLKEFPQARRRQAFPASGNRSATFR